MTTMIDRVVSRRGRAGLKSVNSIGDWKKRFDSTIFRSQVHYNLKITYLVCCGHPDMYD